MATDINKLKELRVYNLHPELHVQILNIASHLGVNVSDMLRPVLKQWVETQPKHWRTTNANGKDYLSDLRCYQRLQEISDHVGIPMSELIKDLEQRYRK